MPRFPTIRAARSAALLLLAPALGAQAPAPQHVLDRYAVRAGTLQALDLPQGRPGAFAVELILDGVPHVLEVRLHDLRAPGFRLLVDDGVEVREAPAPAVLTLRGTVRGKPGSSVAVSWVEGGLWGVVDTGEQEFGLQALPGTPGAHLVYSSRDVISQGVTCCTHAPGRMTTPLPPAPAGSTVVAEIALDADYHFYSRHGGMTGATNAMLSILNSVDAIYQRDAGIQYLVTSIVIRTTPLYRSDGSDMYAFLQEFQDYWNRFHMGITRDVAQLFSGKGQWKDTIGIAWMRAVCTSHGYGVSRTVHSNAVLNVMLVAHELGHNWGADHCDANTQCYVMCSKIGGCKGAVTQLGPVAKSEINTFKSACRCLSFPVPGRFDLIGTGCPGTANKRPALRATNRPVAGRMLDLTLRDARPGSTGWLVFGTSASKWHGITLPWDLTPFGGPECAVFVSIDMSLRIPTGGIGSVDISLRLPGNAAGATLYTQCLILDPANLLGLVTTNGGAALIGTH